MAYEQGMSIRWENNTKCVVVFRGREYPLPGHFQTHAEALRAGETFCRQLGWAG